MDVLFAAASICLRLNRDWIWPGVNGINKMKLVKPDRWRLGNHLSLFFLLHEAKIARRLPRFCWWHGREIFKTKILIQRTQVILARHRYNYFTSRLFGYIKGKVCGTTWSSMPDKWHTLWTLLDALQLEPSSQGLCSRQLGGLFRKSSMSPKQVVQIATLKLCALSGYVLKKPFILRIFGYTREESAGGSFSLKPFYITVRVGVKQHRWKYYYKRLRQRTGSPTHLKWTLGSYLMWDRTRICTSIRSVF